MYANWCFTHGCPFSIRFSERFVDGLVVIDWGMYICIGADICGSDGLRNTGDVALNILSHAKWDLCYSYLRSAPFGAFR